MDGSLARRIYAFAVICTFCLSFFSAPSQADITVADNLKNSVGMSSYDIGIGTSNIINGPLVFTNESGGQRFVAGASGNLTTITSNVATWNPGNDSLNVSIYQASGNVPGTLLGSLLAPPSSVSSAASNPRTTFDFTADHIALTAGQSYVVTFSVADPSPTDDRYIVYLLPIATSNFGITPIFAPDSVHYQNEPLNYEIGLTVNATPEPGATTLLTGGLLMSLLRRRRR